MSNNVFDSYIGVNPIQFSAQTPYICQRKLHVFVILFRLSFSSPEKIDFIFISLKKTIFRLKAAKNFIPVFE